MEHNGSQNVYKIAYGFKNPRNFKRYLCHLSATLMSRLES